MNNHQSDRDQLQAEESEDDDRPVGRILSRREVLALLGGGSALLIGSAHVLAAETVYLPLIANNSAAATATPIPSSVTATPITSTPTTAATMTPTATATSVLTPTPDPTAVCVVRPEMTVGPYFVDEKLNRADVRGDRSGAELQLTLRVYSVANGACTAISGAFVDIWHCDATGLYSDISQEGTAGQTFLRGYQVSDSNGVVNFTTIYPGWYTGRAVHIHFKIRDALTTNPAQYHFISQFFFNEELTTQVYAQSPYASKGTRDTLNSTDNIYNNNNGSQMVLAVAQSGSVYKATFDIGFAI